MILFLFDLQDLSSVLRMLLCDGHSGSRASLSRNGEINICGWTNTLTSLCSSRFDSLCKSVFDSILDHCLTFEKMVGSLLSQSHTTPLKQEVAKSAATKTRGELRRHSQCRLYSLTPNGGFYPIMTSKHRDHVISCQVNVLTWRLEHRKEEEEEKTKHLRLFLVCQSTDEWLQQRKQHHS